MGHGAHAKGVGMWEADTSLACQEVSDVELSVPSLPGATLVVRVAAVTVSGRHYAVAALVVGEHWGENAGGAAAAEGSALAELTLHWGCARREREGGAPPHTF